jgi:hypothetical protein
MNRTCLRLIACAMLGLVVGTADWLWTGDVPSGSFVSQAEARIGRPLTPMSYAGVARRTTRRAVATGAVATGAYAYSRPGCRQYVNAYGQMVYRCP